MASPKTLPNELLHKIVDILVKEGLHGTAVSLACTDKSLESRVLSRIYRSVVENETFFLAHWAAEHDQTSTLKRAIEAGADINEPWTSCNSNYEKSGVRGEQKYRRLRAADLDCKELHQAIKQRSKLIADQWYMDEQWYHRKENYYEKISETQMKWLVNHYVALDGEVNHTGPIDQYAEALETKRMFLDAFAFWATPLHIAIREGNDAIVEALVQNEKLDLNSSMYGNCLCTNDSGSYFYKYAFSALHQALCLSKSFYVPQLIRLGTSYLTVKETNLDTSVDTLVVKPVLATSQPRNLLHEMLSHEHYFGWEDGPWKWCLEKHCRGVPGEWIVNLLLDNGYESRLNERDDRARLPVEIACGAHQHRAVIIALLQRGISQYDSSISVPFRPGKRNPGGNLIIDTGSILTWAIAENNLQLAQYLLTQEIMQPLFDISAPSARWGYTALHVLCMEPWWRDQDVTGPLRKQILPKILKKTEVDTVSSGHTPLTHALKWLVDSPEPGSPPLQLINSLLHHGADTLNQNQRYQRTPLEIFLNRIVISKYYSTNAREKAQGDYPLYRPDKQSSLLQAIAKIRLYDYRAGDTDGLDDIFHRLRDPVDLAWVPKALKKLRRIRHARILDQQSRTEERAS